MNWHLCKFFTNFAKMNVIRSILTVFVCALLAMTSIVQYHHHDEDGAICLVPGITFHHHHHHHCCEDADDDCHNENIPHNEEECVAHLSQVDVVKYSADIKPLFAILSFTSSIDVIDKLLISSDYNYENTYFRERFYRSHKLSVRLLRAPPCC